MIWDDGETRGFDLVVGIAIASIIVICIGAVAGVFVGGIVGTVAAIFADDPVETYRSIVVWAIPLGILVTALIAIAIAAG